jgi:hypothetical protein
MLNLAGLLPEYRKGLKAGKRRHHPCQRDFVTAAFNVLENQSVACGKTSLRSTNEATRTHFSRTGRLVAHEHRIFETCMG